MRQEIRIVLISAAIFTLYLPVAYFVGRNFVQVPRPEGAYIEHLLKIEKTGGFGYQVQSYGTSQLSDADESNQKSPVLLYENTTLLGPAHSSYRAVKDIGMGRYSHTRLPERPDSWAFFSFSTSDNSDPRTNGRTYWAVVPK